MKQCAICLRTTKGTDKLCYRHRKKFIYDSSIRGFRLKKAKNGTATRYVRKKFHSHEIELTKILERYYGASNVVTGYHPLWAVSEKGALLEYDIFIKDKKILIEYNGIQHYQFTKFFHKVHSRFFAQEKRDVHKIQLAKDNDFKLVVVKYDEPLVEDYIVMKIGGSDV